MAVRRRADTSERPPRELVDFVVDAWLPTGHPRDPWASTTAWKAWSSARSQWVSCGGTWPGGDAERVHQEAASMPDEPFCGCFDEHHCLGLGCPNEPISRNYGLAAAEAPHPELLSE